MTLIILTCLVSSFVQSVAIFFIFFLTPHELLFLFWFFIYCCGWLVNLIVIENIFNWDQKKRWIRIFFPLAVSFFAPLLLISFVFKKREIKNPKLVIASGISLFVGVILTVIMEFLLPLDFFKINENYSDEMIVANEKEAILGLEKFFKAQQDYFNTTHHYALFPIHLWQDVDEQGGAIPLRLIDKKLAFAMGPSLAVKGYYFMALFNQENKGHEYENRLLDYGKEWAILALPEIPKKSGRYFFLIRQDGIIWQKQAIWGEPKQLAWDLNADGWSKNP